MSLLIKALDKAQNANTEQAQAEKANANQKQTDKGNIGNETKTDVNSALELSLSPNGSILAEPGNVIHPATSSVTKQNSSRTVASSTANSSPPQNLSSKSAANVFSAKGIAEKNDNKRLALIAGFGLLVLLAMGAYFYQFVDNTPDVVIPQRSIAMHQAPPLQQTGSTPM